MPIVDDDAFKQLVCVQQNLVSFIAHCSSTHDTKKTLSKCSTEETAESLNLPRVWSRINIIRCQKHRIPWKSTCAVCMPLAQWFIASFFYLLILSSELFKLITKWTQWIFMDICRTLLCRHWTAQEVQSRAKNGAPNKWVNISFSSRWSVCMPWALSHFPIHKILWEFNLLLNLQFT